MEYNPVYLRPEVNIRSRREVSANDHVNSRLHENWQTSTPVLRNCNVTQIPYMDMKPIMTRTDQRIHHPAPKYDPGSTLTGKYFDKYDITTDSRNVARELNSTVYEEPSTRGVKEAQRLAERQFTARWVSAEDTQSSLQARLKAGEALLPLLNDMKKIYK